MKTTIQVTFAGGKKLEARVGDKTISTDLPPEMGGNGTAPEPFTLFMSSIATCAALYALNFCEAREIPIEGMGLKLDYGFDLKTKRCDTLTIDLKLPAGFPPKYKKAVLKAMDLCSVKRHMLNPPEFIINAK